LPEYKLDLADLEFRIVNSECCSNIRDLVC